MAWAKTYTHTIAVAVDVFTASLIWNHYDITVSSLCGLALRADPDGTSFRCRLGRLLNGLFPGHCEAAIASDAARAVAALATLGVKNDNNVTPGAAP